VYKPQRIRDPIHNLIGFDADEFENVMWDVIQSQPFQRLRRVKQLGFSDLVYPGATHSRFAHSVGVFHTARQLMKVIQAHAGKQRYQGSKAHVALAASLVHDVGHGPFSHAFEDVGRRLGLKLADHEVVSQRLIRDSEISLALRKLGGGFPDDVADVIESNAPRNIYDAVVSSQFDADRLDYIRRDRMMAGSSHGVIDYDWLVSNLEIGTVEVGVDTEKTGELETFVIGPKAVYAAEAYILGLFQLYPTIYFHKTTRSAEKIFTEMMVRVFEFARNDDWEKTGLPQSHPIIRFAVESDDIERALELDDSVVWGALSQLRDSKDAGIGDLADRLWRRHLMKVFDVKVEIKRRLRTNISADQIEDAADRIALKVVEKAELWRKMLKKRLVLFDRYTRSPYREFHETKGPLNQILVREVSGKLVDLGEFSPMVQAIRPFELIRYYYDQDDHESREMLNKIVSGEMAK
jgi:HD superfamily phosphohydrolase